jgi:NTE family protein
MSVPKRGAKPVNLALQGGGAHGAFTWGVLDRLLEIGDLAIEGLSGTSAGAMNAVLLTAGWHRGGADGAREHLDRFWTRVAREARVNPIQPTPLDLLFGRFNLDASPSYVLYDVLSRFFSPYDINPLNINPLRDLVAEMVDFEAVRACDALKLYVSATNVHTGKLRVFRAHEMTVDMVMASACLPFLFQAVEIGGEPYWDGGYGGNPALWPFFYETSTDDLLLVQINPVVRRETPRAAREIMSRVNEITFNAALLRELRAIELVGRLKDQGRLEGTHYRKINVHRIDGAGALVELDLNASSKLNTSWAFLTTLKERGRAAADAFVATHLDAVGERSTVDLRAEID